MTESRPFMEFQDKPRASAERTPSPETSRASKIEMLFDHCFRIREIKNGDEIPVGGKNLFKKDSDVFVEVDADAFAEFLKQTQTERSGIDLDRVKSILEENRIAIDPSLFRELLAFSITYNKSKYKTDKPDKEKRNDLYFKRETPPKLSEVLAAHAAMCVEIATLAKLVLQNELVETELFSGEIIWDEDMIFPEDHTFIVLRSGEQTFIFDPTNPTASSMGPLPSLYTAKADFTVMANRKQKGFINMQNIFSKKEVLFGTGNHTAVARERHVVTV